MPIKLVELGIWLDERDEAPAPAPGAKESGAKSGQGAPATPGHLMGMLLEALTNPGALAPLTEDLTLWIAACDHLQTCAICRSGLAALAGVGDTPEGTLGALLAHAAHDGGDVGAGERKPPRAPTSRAGAAQRLIPAPDASALASYVALICTEGEARAAARLPGVASHLRGCPLCRRDVADALAALQSLAPALAPDDEYK